MPLKKDRHNSSKAVSDGQRDISSLSLVSRSMPESLEAEAAVLGSMILDPQCVNIVSQKLTASSFYRVEHQMIFDAVMALSDRKNEAFDLLLLRDELKNRKQLEEVGGPEYLVKIAESVPSSANIEHYVQIVSEKQISMKF